MKDLLDDEDSAGSLKDFIDDSDGSKTSDSDTSNDDDTESENEKGEKMKKTVPHKRVTRAAIAANSMFHITISNDSIMCENFII